MVLCERSCHKEYTYNIKALSSSPYGLKVMAKFKVFVHPAEADTDVDTDDMTTTLAPQIFFQAIYTCITFL